VGAPVGRPLRPPAIRTDEVHLGIRVRAQPHVGRISQALGLEIRPEPHPFPPVGARDKMLDDDELRLFRLRRRRDLQERSAAVGSPLDAVRRESPGIEADDPPAGDAIDGPGSVRFELEVGGPLGVRDRLDSLSRDRDLFRVHHVQHQAVGPDLGRTYVQGTEAKNGERRGQNDGSRKTYLPPRSGAAPGSVLPRLPD
jgi:hypothetical protein